MSSTMERVFRGEFPPSFTFLVNNVAFKTAYFLADGIYPAWALFIKTIFVGSTALTEETAA
jgi:Plant transposon protein